MARRLQGKSYLTQPGREKDIVFNIMRKYFDRQEGSNTLFSAFYRESIPGYVYLEANKQAHVMEAIDGIQNVYISKLRLVPVNEMVDCLAIKASPNNAQAGAWVRVKRGKYGGDLGQILEMSEVGDSAVVKLIPRLDMSKDAGITKRKKTGLDVRHSQKLFNPNDFKYIMGLT